MDFVAGWFKNSTTTQVLFGWLNFEEDLSEENVRQARNATFSLQHRGPDDNGEWSTDMFQKVTVLQDRQ